MGETPEHVATALRGMLQTYEDDVNYTGWVEIVTYLEEWADEHAAEQIKKLGDEIEHALVTEFEEVSAKIRAVREGKSTEELKLLEGEHGALDTALGVSERCLHQALEQLEAIIKRHQA